MKKVLLSVLVAVTATACGGSSSSGGSTMPSGGDDVGTITIRNTSSYDVYSLQLAPWDSASWGRNLIDNDVLMHGDAQKVAVFDCQKYDLRLVDHENDECVIQDIDLCFQDKDWEIDDSVLAGCQTAWSAH